MAKRRNPHIPEDVPVVVKPFYTMATVNHPIKLYEGDLELEQGAKRLPGKGTVEFAWLPRPGVRFSFDPSENSQQPELASGTLHLLGINWHAKVSVLGISNSFGRGVTNLTGVVEDFEIGQNQHVESIIFHITNFNDYIGLGVRGEKGSKVWASRSVIEAGEWRITIDKNETSDQLFRELKAVGGFAVTHVGKLERLDGKKFAAKNSEKVFEALFRYLSFCRGAWVAPILPVGFDENGDRVWEKWRGWKIEHWKNVDNWFNALARKGCRRVFRVSTSDGGMINGMMRCYSQITGTSKRTCQPGCGRFHHSGAVRV
jgi:hypothetical protein